MGEKQRPSLRTEDGSLIEVMKDEGIETMKVNDIARPRGHVTQLTQSISQLALPPGQEEARAKSWWQFWR